MTLPFELYIATRYLLARRRQAFISVISAVSALGVTVGVMALVIALALMTGMQEELRDKIVGSAAHVYVQKLLGGGFVDYEAEVAKLVEVPGVVAAAPAMLGRGMAAAAGVNAFITLKGVDPVLEDAPAVARAVTDSLGAEYFAEDWGQLNQALFSALWLEKMAIGIAIGLIMMVAALNIVASLVLLVMEKSRDIAILKTMGASSSSVRIIFVLQGGIIGAVGTAVGASCGVAVSWFADRYQLIRLPAAVYDVGWLPFRVEPGNLLVVVLGSLAVCLLATLYPSRQASRLDPAEALRYE